MNEVLLTTYVLIVAGVLFKPVRAFLRENPRSAERWKADDLIPESEQPFFRFRGERKLRARRRK